MKKTFFKTLLISILCLTTLTSCSLLEYLGELLDNAVASQETNSGNVYKVDSSLIRATSLNIEEGKAGTNTTIKQFKNTEGYQVFPSTGTPNLLVIPVYFTDFTPESCLSVTREEARDDIYKTFFGTSSDSNDDYMTGWESVSSYYYKSSYGNLNIKGMVTDWYAYPSTLLSAACTTSYSDPTNPIVRKAVEWFKENYPDEVSNYDLDGNGYLDGVVLVYANTYASGTTYRSYAGSSREDYVKDLCWAYTTWDNNTSSTLSPNAGVYMWVSYDFMWEGDYRRYTLVASEKLVDAHTYIHEFGHMMGLDDYYSCDDDSQEPLGKLDMMDYNIGDHNSYSKYLLGWMEPTLITGEGTYTISALVDKGEALLIPASLDDYCYSAFDEYILVEMYSPTGNNAKDASEKYCGSSSSYPYMYTNYGVRMLHVDSRMVAYNSINGKYSFTQTSEINSLYQSIMIGPSNTSSYSINSNYKLISLISKRGRTDYFTKSPTYANNNDLFYKGDYYNDLTFDNGCQLDYSIVVTNIDTANNQATITIVKN